MPVPSNLSDLSTNAAANSPAATDTISTTDDYLRAHAAILAKVGDGTNALTTPALGAATATSINKLTITAPATSATLTVANGKTLTASNTLTLTGTDGSSVAFGAGGTVAYQGGKLSQFAATSSAELAGVISDETGTGSLVFANTPTLVTPNIGAATGTSLNLGTGALTAGSGTFGSGNTSAVIRSLSGNANNFALYNGGLTPSSTNYALSSNYLGTETVLNSTGHVYQAVSGSVVTDVSSTGLAVTGASSTFGGVASSFLHVNGTDTVAALRLQSSGTNKSQFVIASGNTYCDYDGALNFRIGINGSNAATLDASGNLGLGASPIANYRAYIESAGATSATYGLLIRNSSLASLFAVRSDLLVTINGFVSAWTTGSAANVYANPATGDLYRSTSALKYKQDIRDLDPVDVNSLRPVRYKSKCTGDDPNKDFIGFIADEAANSGWDELVSRGADGEVEGFQYERVTALLWKVCQQLSAELRDTKTRLEALEAK